MMLVSCLTCADMAAVGLGAAGKPSPEILGALERAVLTPGGPPIPRTSAFDALMRLGVPRDRLQAAAARGLDDPDEDLRRSSRATTIQTGSSWRSMSSTRPPCSPS